MRLLLRYSKQYWQVVLAALVLSAISQICSMLDPLIFRHVIDDYATKYDKYTQAQFIHGAGLLLVGDRGVAFVSRVCQEFSGLFHQRDRAADRRADVLRRGEALAGFAVSGF